VFKLTGSASELYVELVAVTVKVYPSLPGEVPALVAKKLSIKQPVVVEGVQGLAPPRFAKAVNPTVAYAVE